MAEYDDIPGTYVFDGRRSRAGYHLNMFCMTLNEAANRDAFTADPEDCRMTEEKAADNASRTP